MGFGPAGLGLFTAALAAGSFAELMAGDPLVLDRAAGGVGRLGRYAIESDSFVESFVAAILERTDDDDLRPRGPWAEQAVAELAGQVEARRGGPVPLPWAAAVQDVLARMVSAEADRLGHPLTVRRRSEVVAARRTRDGTWLVQWRRSDEDGADVLERAEARNVVLAGGAVQRPADLAGVRLAGVAPWRDLPQRVMGSDEVLAHGGVDLVRQRLRSARGSPGPRVVIVGGSHSALACATVVLAAHPGPSETAEPVRTGNPRPVPGEQNGWVTILHRQPLRPMYPSVAQAHAEGFHDFRAEDICPVTQRVLPLAGFRAASRELLLRILALGERPAERRVRLVDLTRTEDTHVRGLLQAADLVILATGYRRETVPVFDVDGRPIRLQGEHDHRPHVDERSRVRTAQGEMVDGLFATGLDTGYPMAGRFGEPSFTGTANGTALWQTTIGTEIVDQCLARSRAQRGSA